LISIHLFKKEKHESPALLTACQVQAFICHGLKYRLLGRLLCFNKQRGGTLKRGSALRLIITYSIQSNEFIPDKQLLIFRYETIAAEPLIIKR